MSRRTSHLKLKEAVAHILSEQPRSSAVKRVVEESYRLAFAYLQQKVRRQDVQPDFFGLSLEDLALDCIADLFQRSADGRFVLLEGYFRAIGWRDHDDEELHIALRRLVFNKVNEGLFRRYKESDPSLAKIIRNLKRAAKSNPSLSLVRNRGELWLVVGPADTLPKPLPTAPAEILEAHLMSCLQHSDELNAIVSSFVEFIRERPFYANGYPLSSFAQMVRSSFIRMESALDEAPNEDVFLPGEVQQAIMHVSCAVQTAKHRFYVADGKVDDLTFITYFFAVRDILAAQFISDVPPVDSYPEALKLYMPGLSESTYRQKHRHILEYLTKLTRTELFGYLRKNYHVASNPLVYVQN